MKVRLACLAALSIAVILGSTSAPNLVAQEKADKVQKGAPKKANIQGIVQNMGKDSATITIRVSTATATRQVVYDANTKFRYGHSNDNKPGTVAQVKESSFISCAGTFNAKDQLMANECVYREAK